MYCKGYEEAGTIFVDMTDLKTRGLVDRKLVRRNRFYKQRPKKYYEVDLDLVIFVDGRNLRFEARYPCGSTGDDCVRVRGRFCIASAFLDEPKLSGYAEG
ncbi:hypothetical protein EYZ11_012258 [Aspergillus tanneri]|uniref:Uncharacterized protein n=1 Tax=Aspergillus tanneri TaxID=1220188 RepID=A0A4S3J0Z1_9EURO|nr:hypothetical protein EYZ11_012258 [Aspergillus tanneri]